MINPTTGYFEMFTSGLSSLANTVGNIGNEWLGFKTAEASMKNANNTANQPVATTVPAPDNTKLYILAGAGILIAILLSRK